MLGFLTILLVVSAQEELWDGLQDFGIVFHDEEPVIVEKNEVDVVARNAVSGRCNRIRTLDKSSHSKSKALGALITDQFTYSSKLSYDHL